MKNKVSGFLKRLLHILVIIIIGGYLVSNIVDLTYAIVNTEDPNIIITIKEDGQITQEGNLYGEDLWYPDREDSGIIRIKNNFKKIKVTNLGLEVDLKTFIDGYNEGDVYSSFVNNMKLTIKKGRFLFFDKDILDIRSIQELLYKANDDSYNGLILVDSDQITINKDDSIDLKYTLYMDEEAGEELESVKANVTFYINFNESQ